MHGPQFEGIIKILWDNQGSLIHGWISNNIKQLFRSFTFVNDCVKKRALSFIATDWNVYRWDGKMSGICLKNPVLVEESEWVIDETWLAKS